MEKANSPPSIFHLEVDCTENLSGVTLVNLPKLPQISYQRANFSQEQVASRITTPLRSRESSQVRDNEEPRAAQTSYPRLDEPFEHVISRITTSSFWGRISQLPDDLADDKEAMSPDERGIQALFQDLKSRSLQVRLRASVEIRNAVFAAHRGMVSIPLHFMKLTRYRTIYRKIPRILCSSWSSTGCVDYFKFRSSRQTRRGVLD